MLGSRRDRARWGRRLAPWHGNSGSMGVLVRASGRSVATFVTDRSLKSLDYRGNLPQCATACLQAVPEERRTHLTACTQAVA